MFLENKNKTTTPATLCRILDLAEDDTLSHINKDDQIKVTVLLPINATGNITDKNSGDKDGSEQSITLTIKTIQEQSMVQEQSGSMLIASAKLDHERSTTTEDDDEPVKKKPKKKAEKLKRNWVHIILASDQALWIPANAHMDIIKAKRLSL